MSTARTVPTLIAPALLAAMAVLYGGQSHAQEPPGVEGVWIASQEAQGQTLRSQLVVTRDANGLACTLDVIELNAWNVGCTAPLLRAGEFSFQVPIAQGSWRGRLSDDGGSMQGTWTQAAPPAEPSALRFVRQAQRVTPPPPPPVSFDAAMAPVEPAQIEEVLRADLARPLASGLLAPGGGIGIAVGVITRNGRSAFTLGTARRDSIFEIGSITKTFTGLALAQLVEQGRVRPDTPVRELLPAGVATKPAGAEITLFDLVTHHSGLPRLPDNFDATSNPANPYAAYDATRLHAWLASNGVAKPEGATLAYSNLGAGLLGHALARAARQDFAALVDSQILQPLGMRDSAFQLSAVQRERLIPGRGADLAQVPHWEWDVLTGAGGLRSTLDDMMKYLAAQLAPDQLVATGAGGTTLPAALRRAQQPRAGVAGGMGIAHAWLNPRAGLYYHDGGTGGFSSFMVFDTTQGMGVLVLVNFTLLSPKGNFAEAIAQHIVQRVLGQPALSLAGW